MCIYIHLCMCVCVCVCACVCVYVYFGFISCFDFNIVDSNITIIIIIGVKKMFSF